MKLAKRLEERFLGNILGFVTIPEQVRRSPNEAISVPLNDQTKGRIVPFPTTGDPRELVAWIKSNCRVQVSFKHGSNDLPLSMIARLCRISKQVVQKTTPASRLAS